jgi:hypothetical protein
MKENRVLSTTLHLRHEHSRGCLAPSVGRCAARRTAPLCTNTSTMLVFIDPFVSRRACGASRFHPIQSHLVPSPPIIQPSSMCRHQDMCRLAWQTIPSQSARRKEKHQQTKKKKGTTTKACRLGAREKRRIASCRGGREAVRLLGPAVVRSVFAWSRCSDCITACAERQREQYLASKT